MSTRYLWRQLSPEKRAELLEWRKARARPWHSPPNRSNLGRTQFHVAAACYEHAPHIGFDADRMEGFSAGLLKALDESGAVVHAWCVLPNHYHALVESEDVLEVIKELGRFHG